MKGTLMFSWGRYGGFCCHSSRLCLGWVAFTFFPHEVDDVLRVGLEVLEKYRPASADMTEGA